MEQKPVVILLGGSGFIGSHLTRDFAQKNWRVIVVTRFPDQTRDKLGHIKQCWTMQRQSS